MIWGIALLYTVIIAGLLVVVRKQDLRKYYIAAKTLSSLAFVGVLFVAGAVSEQIHQFWLMLPAFLFCFGGDVLMAFYNRYRKKIHFIMGLSIFLVGHLCFARWLCWRGKITVIDIVLSLIAVLLCYGLTGLEKIHTGRLRPFILIYAFFIGFVCVKGVHLWINNQTAAGAMIAAGGFLFLLSDISILFLYFYKSRGNRIQVFNLLTYYYGMLLLAFSLFFM